MKPEVLEFTVTVEDHGRRLDQVVSERLEVSRSQLEKHVHSGALTIDGAPPTRGKRTRVHAGMRLVYRPPAPEPPGLDPEPMTLSVLFEDPHILVVDKPPHVVVHPGEGHPRGTLLAGVLHHVGRLPATDPVRPGVVHRLDRGTTGVMVFAKSLEAHTELVDSFRRRSVQKTYLAVTQGVPSPLEGTFDTLYGRHPQHRQRFSSRVPYGKTAVTHYEVLETYPGAASVQVDLETGRTHQIRVHFADAGHPLVGEETYGRRGVIRDPLARQVTDQLTRPALHAWELSLRHPVSQRKLRFTAPLPRDLVELLEGLRDVGTLRERP